MCVLPFHAQIVSLVKHVFTWNQLVNNFLHFLHHLLIFPVTENCRKWITRSKGKTYGGYEWIWKQAVYNIKLLKSNLFFYFFTIDSDFRAALILLPHIFKEKVESFITLGEVWNYLLNHNFVILWYISGYTVLIDFALFTDRCLKESYYAISCFNFSLVCYVTVCNCNC